MKRFLKITIITVIMAFVVATVSLATTVKFEENYINDGDFIMAAFNGTKPFFADQMNLQPVEDACYWLADYASALNLKYVSFNGNMSSRANYTYQNYVAAGKGTIAQLYVMNETDEEWRKDFAALKNTASILADADIPYGLSIGLYDYCANGFDRRNLVTTTFNYSDFFGDANVETEKFDINNYAIKFSVGTVKYIVYQLEAFPRKRVIDWFNTTQSKNRDKRAFVFTTSFLDSNGEMYTQHDWSVYPTFNQWFQVYTEYNTSLKSNILHIDAPRDGDQLWKDAFASWDNLMLIVSANASVDTKIVTKKLVNNNGKEVLAVVTNLDGGHATNDLGCPVLFKISADNKTIDIRYAVPDYDSAGGYIQETKTVVTFSDISELPENVVLPGDISGDGEVDLKDVTTIRRHLAGGYGVSVVDAALDVNSDGAVDLKDVTYLRRALAGGYGIVLK